MDFAHPSSGWRPRHHAESRNRFRPPNEIAAGASIPYRDHALNGTQGAQGG